MRAKATGITYKVGKFLLVEKECDGEFLLFLMLGKKKIDVFDSYGEAMQKKGEWMGVDEDSEVE